MKRGSQSYWKLWTLERYTWPENGWVSYPEKNGLEIRRVVFSNEFTPENIVKSFSKESTNCEEAFSFRGWSGNGARRSWKSTGCSYEVKKAPNVWNSVKAQCRIKWLENNLAAKNQEINRRDYLATKELPALPKQHKENRLHKLKKLISKVKEKTKEKFQTFIIQKSK